MAEVLQSSLSQDGWWVEDYTSWDVVSGGPANLLRAPVSLPSCVPPWRVKRTGSVAGMCSVGAMGECGATVASGGRGRGERRETQH